jgi:cytochrome c biogenesis protein CcmG/thiol:disulfide interchange protein DsbE
LIKKGLVFIFTGLLLGTVLGGLVIFSSAAPKRGPVIGSMLEDFVLPGINKQTISLNQYRGKTIILNFWATWCVPCKDEMPLLQSIYQTSGEKLVVIGVNSQESEGDVQRFIDQNFINFPIALDASGEITRKFQINGYPTTFLIDSKGILRNLHIGVLREDLLQSYLAELGVQ